MAKTFFRLLDGLAPYGRVPHPPNHRLPPRYKRELGDKEIVPITPTIPTPSPPLSSQQLVSVAQVPAVSSVTPATTPTQCHSISASPLTEVHPPPLHFMYWCLMACPGLMSGHSREIIEVPFKSFPHWKPSTELQEDICNVTILKRSVITIHNDMKTEYTKLRQISPIKIRTKTMFAL